MSSSSGWSAGGQAGSQMPSQQPTYHIMPFDEPSYILQQQGQYQQQAVQQQHHHHHHQPQHHHHQAHYNQQHFHNQGMPESGGHSQQHDAYTTNQPQYYTHQHSQPPPATAAAFGLGPSFSPSSSSPSQRPLHSAHGGSSSTSTLSSAFGSAVDYPAYQQGGERYMEAEGQNVYHGASASMLMDTPNPYAQGTTVERQDSHSNFQWPSPHSSTINPNTQFDLYGTLTNSSSEASLASESSAGDNQALGHQQHPMSIRFNEPNAPIQRARRPAALELHEPQNDHIVDSSWPAQEVTTPNATSRYSRQQQQQDRLSPTWQPSPSQNYPTGLLSPAQIQDSFMNDVETFPNHILSDFVQNNPDTVKRHRPNIRPNIYQQYAPFSMPLPDEPMGGDHQDCSPFINEVLNNYLATPSRLGLGERSVMIMTSKVAQKSYGAEKRFLCPPPMVLLLGSSWWSACHESSRGGSSSPNDGTPAMDDAGPTLLTPPRLSISMSGESNLQDSMLEWASNSGRLIDVGNPSSEMAISGRSIGRQLYINDSDEKRRHCEALVHITVPGISSSDRRLLGTFASKPIKVISKPSKKRQSTRTSDLSVNHGSTISLFHRLRSQTVSTRYLCVSGAPTWFKGSDGVPFLNSDANHHIPNQREPSTCFVAKMSSWDPFIIYLVDPQVDPSKVDHSDDPSGSTDANSDKTPPKRPPPAPGYPPVPINVLPLPVSGQGPPICYNQAVVLQCLNTAVVSPVMVIRKVDRGTTVLGGSQSNIFSSTLGEVDPGAESLGDPVSQLHKVAFEVLQDPKAPAPVAENRDVSGPGPSGSFLGCLNEEVGLRTPVGSRQWVATSFSGPPTPTTPVTPMNLPSSSSSSVQTATSLLDPMDSLKVMNDPMTSASIAAAQAAAQNRYSMSQARGGSMTSPSTSMAGPSSGSSWHQHHPSSLSHPVKTSPTLSSGDEDGGKIKRPRRVSSSVVVAQRERNGSAAKNRRRGQSLSIVGIQNQLNSQQIGPPSQQTQPLPHHHQHSTSSHSSYPLTSIPSSNSNESRMHLRRTSSFANSLTNSETSSLGVPSGAVWSVDVHDSDVWTIVGTDIARHTFYVPTKLVGGVKAKMESTDEGIAHLINVPAPSTPITPLPVVYNFHTLGAVSSKSVAGGSSSSRAGPNKQHSTGSYVTLMGENLTGDLFVYFGDWRSTRVSNENSSTLYCKPPPKEEEFGLPRGKVPITLVRRDGVIFPTPHIYEC